MPVLEYRYHNRVVKLKKKIHPKVWGRGTLDVCALHPSEQNISHFSWVLQIPLQLFMVGGQHGGHGAHALEAVVEGHKSGPEHAPTPLQEMVAITAEDQALKEGDATRRDVLVY